MSCSGWAFGEMLRRVAKLVRQINTGLTRFLWRHGAVSSHIVLGSVEPKVRVDLAGGCSPRRCRGLSILVTEVGGNATAKHAAGRRTCW